MENEPKKVIKFEKMPEKGQDSKDFSIGNLAFKGKTKRVAQAKKRAKLTDEIVKQLNNTEVIPIGKGVSIVIFKDKGLVVTESLNLLGVLEIEQVYPDAFVGLLPSLFEDFVVNDTINPFVKVGDIVTIQRKYLEKKGDIPRKVTEIYFKSLNDMTVVIAVLEDGDLVLTNTLVICK